MDAQSRLFGRADNIRRFIQPTTNFENQNEHTAALMQALGIIAEEENIEEPPADTGVSNKRARNGFQEECSSEKCARQLGEKNTEIGRLHSIVEDLRKVIREKDETIEKYRESERQQKKDKEILELEEMLKKILERFYKGHFKDSNLHPTDDQVMTCLNYLVKTFSEEPLKAMKYVSGNKIRYRLWVRSKRNRLTRLVKEGYEKSGNLISLEGIGKKNWHYRGDIPFNHPGVLAGARNAFLGNGSAMNVFTMNQLCFATSVVELKSKGINLTEKTNFDKLKGGTEKYQEEMVQVVQELKQKNLATQEGNQIKLGIVTIIEGQLTVLESIQLDPQFWDTDKNDNE